MPINLPQGCPRGLNCDAVSRIESDDGTTFICVGRNDGLARTVEQDVLTKCVRSETCDTRENLDMLDLIDEGAVIAIALAVLARRVV